MSPNSIVELVDAIKPTALFRSDGNYLLTLNAPVFVSIEQILHLVVVNTEPNDTFHKQIEDNAKALIDYVVDMGVADRRRIGIGGHSYGAFMTANLLAHTDLFAAGIARSGAYNRTLTPFGFQGEVRTFWQVPEV